MSAPQPTLHRDGAKTVLTAPDGTVLKTFERKKIYLHEEYDLAVREQLAGPNVIIIGMNGYSRLTAEQCAAWGVKPGAYERACEVLLVRTVTRQRAEFPGIDVRLIHGASDLGIDASIVAAGRKLRCRMLGFNCPEFMKYVPDDDEPVYVAESKDAYSRAFAKTGHVLIAANGRQQAFRMDISAVLEFSRYLIAVNVLKRLSTNGGPPALNAQGGIEDAVAHYQQRARVIGQQLGASRGSDEWRHTVDLIGEELTDICRQVLPADLGPEIND